MIKFRRRIEGLFDRIDEAVAGVGGIPTVILIPFHLTASPEVQVAAAKARWVEDRITTVL